MHAAIFLDRDGVLNENRADYVKSIDELVFLPAAMAAMPSLAQSPYKVVLVTNQSGVGRGIFSRATAQAINRRVCSQVAAYGGRIDSVYMCVHHPDDGCDCRKPRPGMLLQASAEIGIDLAASYFIGDALTDYQAGVAAGVTPLMVATGRGQAQIALARSQGYQPQTFADVHAAVSWILAQPLSSKQALSPQ